MWREKGFICKVCRFGEAGVFFGMVFFFGGFLFFGIVFRGGGFGWRGLERLWMGLSC